MYDSATLVILRLSRLVKHLAPDLCAPKSLWRTGILVLWELLEALACVKD